ncbi:MAG: glycosyltransferase [Candidatus Pacearchaeota archaeon]|nr:glycosyltransferase [Candidatus Pacearchaeota archaeon]
MVTFYDLISLIIPERKKTYKLFFRFILMFVLKAKHFIAISKSTKKGMQRLLKIHSNKITAIYPGVDFKKFYPLKKEKEQNFCN